MRFSEILQRVVALGQAIGRAADTAERVALERQLRDFLSPLKAAEIYMVITIMYLGRGDFGVAGLLDSYEHMSDTFDKPPNAIEQMLAKSPFAEYLQAGLEKLTQSQIDVDTILTSHINTPLATLDSGDDVPLSIGPWICDTCGKLVEKAEDGMLQWLTRPENNRRVGRDMRIIHHMTASPLDGQNGCYPDEKHEIRKDGSTLSDTHLDGMLGADGLVKLLALVEDGEFPPNDVNRIIMRLFVPGYERARPYFQKALASGMVDQGMPDDYFLQQQLRCIVANRARLDS